MSSRAAAWASAGLLAVHGVLAWLARAPGIETALDDATYLLLARSLRHFSYSEWWRPGTPMHAQYPPGYPALLAAVGWLGGDRVDWLLAINIVASMLSLYLVYRTVARFGEPLLALLVLAALVPNPYLVSSAGLVMSEPVFMLLSLASLALLAETDLGPRGRVLAGAAAIGAGLTRAIGIPLLPAIGVLWLMERRWKAAAALALATALTVGSWLAWTMNATSRATSRTYVGDVASASEAAGGGVLAHYVARVGHHLADYTTTAIPLSLSVPTIQGTIVDNVIGSGLVALCVMAGLVFAWRRWRAAALYLAATFVLLAVWPYIQTRYIVPLIPLLVALALIGLHTIMGRLRPAWSVPVVAACAVVLAVTGAMRLEPLLARRSRCQRGASPPAPSCVNRDQSSFFAATQWIRSRLPADAVIVSSKPETLAYYADRRVVPVRRVLARDSLLTGQAIAAGAQWLLLGSLSSVELYRLQSRLTDECTHLRLTATFPPRTYLFELLETAAADSTACRAMADYQRANVSRDFERDR